MVTNYNNTNLYYRYNEFSNKKFYLNNDDKTD
jgi:hypothetical protein